MFETRADEPAYAQIPDATHPETNRYGKPIETVPEGHELRGQSLKINGDASIGEPDRRRRAGITDIQAGDARGRYRCSIGRG